MNPNQDSKKSIGKKFCTNLQDRRVRQQPKFEIGQLVCTADIKRLFSKDDSTNHSYSLYTITEIIHDTIPSYRIDYMPERCNETLLLPTKQTLEQNNQDMKELNLIQQQNK